MVKMVTEMVMEMETEMVMEMVTATAMEITAMDSNLRMISVSLKKILSSR